MKRKVTDDLIAWKNDPEHKSLIVTGCRQCGKTYAVTEFAEQHYDTVVYINFETDPEKKDYFKGTLEPDTLLPNIEMFEGKEFVKGRSVLVLDEIQACQNAYSSLKPLSRNGSCDVIALGSFLGINLDDNDEGISPLGYVDIIQMYPMDFEELLLGMGIKEEFITSVREHIWGAEPLPDAMNRIVSDLYRRYLVVGGMPEAVSVYSKTSSYPKAMKVLRDIVQILMRDAGKYSRKAGRSKINSCFRSIPQQIARENKRFLYKDIEKTANKGRRTYGSALDWLTDSGIALKCHNLEEPVPPLSESAIEDDFKLYLVDTGILAALMDSFDPTDIVLRDPYSNHGAFMECATASALKKKGYPLYFYRKKNSTLEIDFVLRSGKAVTLLEVKSGRKTRSRSLDMLMGEKGRWRHGIKIMDTNIRKQGDILCMPLYAPCFFEEDGPKDIQPLDVENINSMAL